MKLINDGRRSRCELLTIRSKNNKTRKIEPEIEKPSKQMIRVSNGQSPWRVKKIVIPGSGQEIPAKTSTRCSSS